MGLFSKLFGGATINFVPDFTKTEYDNWLNYLGSGGTTESWKTLKKKNNWQFKADPVEKHLQYEQERRPIIDLFSWATGKIEKDWVQLYDSNDYHSKLAYTIEDNCYTAIGYYEELRKIDLKYHEQPMKPKVFQRLALLYERQDEYEKAIDICKQACLYGIDERNRLKRMIKKAGRTPTKEELELINSINVAPKNTDSKQRNTTPNPRKQIPADEIDRMQRIEASDSYKSKIYKRFYNDYKEKPYISQDRELNTQWLYQAEMFPKQSIIPRETMTRFPDGLLPGHVYMLYWINKFSTKKRIPAYFEYKYGIDFVKERDYLISHGYLTETDKVTEKGLQSMQLHHDVIESH